MTAQTSTTAYSAGGVLVRRQNTGIEAFCERRTARPMSQFRAELFRRRTPADPRRKALLFEAGSFFQDDEASSAIHRFLPARLARRRRGVYPRERERRFPTKTFSVPFPNHGKLERVGGRDGDLGHWSRQPARQREPAKSASPTSGFDSWEIRPRSVPSENWQRTTSGISHGPAERHLGADPVRQQHREGFDSIGQLS